jgi:hypothetical protein
MRPEPAHLGGRFGVVNRVPVGLRIHFANSLPISGTPAPRFCLGPSGIEPGPTVPLAHRRFTSLYSIGLAGI